MLVKYLRKIATLKCQGLDSIFLGCCSIRKGLCGVGGLGGCVSSILLVFKGVLLGFCLEVMIFVWGC